MYLCGTGEDSGVMLDAPGGPREAPGRTGEAARVIIEAPGGIRGGANIILEA